MATHLAILARLVLDFLVLAALCWSVVGIIVLADRRRFPQPLPPPDSPFRPAPRFSPKVRQLGRPARAPGAGRAAASPRGRPGIARRIDG